MARNKLGDQAMASSTICGGRVYMRVVEQVDGKRQEMLYCLAQPKKSDRDAEYPLNSGPTRLVFWATR